MKFALDTEIKDFAASVDEMLGRADVPSAIRAWSEGDTAPGLAVWDKLDQQGVFGLLGDELVFGRVVGVELIRFVTADPVGKRNLAGTRGPHDRASPLLDGIAEFLAEPFVPRAPECRLIRERLES